MTVQPQADDLGAAFTELRQGLHSYLRRRLPDRAAADDLLQDVFVKAIASARAGRRIDNVAGWLYAAARTSLADYFRAAGRAAEPLTEDIPGDVPDPEADGLATHHALAACLKPLIERLPPIYRDTLIATELEGATLRSIAAAEGVSLSAIKSRAARGRAMLRDAVLSCCAVETAEGLVSEYRRIGPAGCGDGCT